MDYSVEKLMTPNIYDIIRVSLKLSNNVIFYLPKNLRLEELFKIFSEITNSDNIYFDVKVIKSADRIKALLVFFGNDSEKISSDDVYQYLNKKYCKFEKSYDFFKLLNTIDISDFFKYEKEYSQIYNDSNINTLIDFIKSKHTNKTLSRCSFSNYKACCCYGSYIYYTNLYTGMNLNREGY